jgi:hypothetical protein
MGDELAAFGVVERRGDGDLDTELVGSVRFPLADALDLGRMQRIDLLAPLVLALVAHREGQRQRLGEDAFQPHAAFDLAHQVAADPAEIGAQRP